jgi:hypothetical protein
VWLFGFVAGGCPAPRLPVGSQAIGGAYCVSDVAELGRVRVVRRIDRQQGKGRSIINGGEKYLCVRQFPGSHGMADCVGSLRAGGFTILAAMPPSSPHPHDECGGGDCGGGGGGGQDRNLPTSSERAVGSLGRPLPLSLPLGSIGFESHTALIFGNERRGVSATALDLVDGCFHVRMFGLAESLNVSVCVALALQTARLARCRALGREPEHGDLSRLGELASHNPSICIRRHPPLLTRRARGVARTATQCAPDDGGGRRAGRTKSAYG